MLVLNPEKFINSVNESEMKESIIAIFNYINIDGIKGNEKDKYEYSYNGWHYNDFKLDVTLTITRRSCIIDVDYKTTISSKSFKRQTSIGFNNRPTLKYDIVSAIVALLNDIRPEHRSIIGGAESLLFCMDYVSGSDERRMLLNNYIFDIGTICDTIKDSLDESEEYIDIDWEDK